MAYEKTSGLGVNNFYGPRTATGAQGPEGKRLKLYRDFTDDTIK